jgi:hypothetical protein
MNLSNIVPNQLPEFVRADYPAFVEFIQAYYKWLTENYILSVEDVVDIDNTVDSYVKHFKRQLDVYGVVSQDDDRLLLKNIKQLYASKGSEAGIDFFFKAFFRTNGTVQYPWDYTFKPSSGIWKQDTSIFIQVQRGNAEDLAGNLITLTDDVGATYQTFVNQVSKRAEGVYELFIDRITVTSPRPLSVRSTDGSIRGQTLTSTIKVTIIDGGSGFEVGQIFRVNTTSGTGSFIKVIAVDSAGAMTAARLIGFGTGYVSNFNLAIFSRTLVSLTNSTIQLNGIEDTIPYSFLYPTNDTAVTSDRGIAVEHNYTDYNTEYMAADYVGRVAAVFENSNQVPLIGFDSALLQFSIGTVCYYPGYYDSNVNLISDATFIQDSYYHQAFSYVTSVDQTLESYSNLLKSVLHPAGTKHFGNYQITDSFNLTPTARPNINVISIADIIRLIVLISDQVLLTANFFRDFAHGFVVANPPPEFVVGKNLTNTTTTASLFDRTVNYDRRPEDGFNHGSRSASLFDRTVTYDRRPVDGFNHGSRSASLFDRTVTYDRRPVDGFNHGSRSASLFDRTVTYDRRPEDGFNHGSGSTSLFSRRVDYDRRPENTTSASSDFSREVIFRPDLTSPAIAISDFGRRVDYDRTDLTSPAIAISDFGRRVDYDRQSTDPGFNHTTISADTFDYINGTILADGVHVSDTGFNTESAFYPSLANLVSSSSNFTRFVDYEPSLTTSALAISNFSREVMYGRQPTDSGFSHTTSVIDANQLNITITTTNSTILSEFVSLNPHKYLTDTVSKIESGYINLSPYAEALPDLYWETGYAENEFNI